MAPHDLRCPFKRPTVRPTEVQGALSLLRQSQTRRDAQQHARRLASTVLSLQSSEPDIELQTETLIESEAEVEQESGDDASSSKDFDVRDASKLRGVEARKWFARQLMLPEWMIDVPDRLSIDWHAHYQTGNTPLALVWKDESCSQYVTGSKSTTVRELHLGNLVRFAIGDEGLSFLDGKLQKADLHYLGKVNRARAFADSYSKVMFQYIARHSPLKIDNLLASVNSSDEKENKPSLRLLVIL